MALHQLSYIVAVAEELYFGRAAARACVAHRALSCQIQSLERELGEQLFIRSTRRVEMTRAEGVYNDRCIRILGDVDLSAETVRSGKSCHASDVLVPCFRDCVICPREPELEMPGLSFASLRNV